jgi:undecaprenyl-diphosphatase
MKGRSWIEIDRRASNALTLQQAHRPARRAAALLAHSADSWFWAIGLLAAAGFGDAWLRPLAIRLLLSMVGLAAGVFLLKQIIRRPRPDGEWGQIYRRSDPHSFPSGHAARAIFLACLLGVWGAPLLFIPLSIWALMVGLARVALGVHFLSDIAAGYVIGLAAAGAVVWILAVPGA